MSKKVNNTATVIKAELDMLEKIEHKNIVKYYGNFTKSNHLYMILEFCAGGAVSKLLKIIKKNEDIIRQYVFQILEGLEYLHIHNIIHRDIKCANILIGKNGICKLADFGGAKRIKEEMTLNNTMQGTPNWMAPEIIKGETATRFCDIWSIGCTILEMYTGLPPYSDKKEAFGVFNAICKKNELPKIPDDMSDTLKDLVKKCLVFEPYKRANVYDLKNHKFFKGNKNEDNSINNIIDSNDNSCRSINIDSTNV